MTDTNSFNIWNQLTKRSQRRRVEEGQRYERLTVISCVGCYDKWMSLRWRCRCDCGRETTTRGDTLLNGTSKSCGCMRKELAFGRLEAARAALALNPTPKGSDGKFIPRHNRDTNSNGPNHG